MNLGKRVWLAGWVAVAAVAALADSHIRIVAVSYVEHQVEVRRPLNGGDAAPRWSPAALNQPVVEGESIRTDVNARAEVELECGSALRLTSQSELSFPRLVLRDDGIRGTTVQLDSGEFYFTLQDSDSRDFHVLLPGGGEVSTGDGGVKLRLDVPAGQPATVEVLDGQVQVRDRGGAQTVKSRQRVEIRPSGGFQALALADTDAGQQWSHQRDDAFQRAVLQSSPTTQVDASQSIPKPALDTLLPILNTDNAGTLFQVLDSGHGGATASPKVPTGRLAPYCAHK
jgi:hypothetical protein